MAPRRDGSPLLLSFVVLDADHAMEADKKKEKTASRLPNLFAAGGTKGPVPDDPSVTVEGMRVFDKIRECQDFFEGLDAVCSDVEDIGSTIKVACSAINSINKLCKSQKNCRDAFLSLMNGMDESTPNYGAGELRSMLKANPSIRAAFKATVDIFIEISAFLAERNRRTTNRFLWKQQLEVLRDKLKREQENLKDSINRGRDIETKKRMELDDLKMKLGNVFKAQYNSSEGCLEDTRTNLLTEVDTWMKGSSSEKTMWVYGPAGSGKSALFNSIAGNLENAGIPFSCFSCKWGDPELSNVHRILPTISYHFAELYDDYRGAIHNAVKEHSGHSISTDDVKKQSKLLFGDLYKFCLISGERSRRPPVHVLLIDAFDGCGNHRDECETVKERRVLLETLLAFANSVPWIKVLITSRLEQDIADVFNVTDCAVRHIDMNSDKWSITPAAMRHFLLVSSEKLDINLSHDQIERFRKKASGCFIWCATAFRYIRRCEEMRTRLIEHIFEDSCPVSSSASLDLLYQRVVESAISEAGDKELVESILGVVFIALTRQPLSATTIADIIYPDGRLEGFKDRRKQFDKIIKSLSAILYVEEETSTIRTYHTTVLDFIGRISIMNSTVPRGQGADSIKPFSIGPEEMHARILRKCLTTMKRELRFNICDLDDSHRLNKNVVDLPARIVRNISGALRYASLLWASHIGRCNVKESGEKVLAFLNSRAALFWIEALSLLGAVDRGIVVLQDCARFFATEPSVVDIANEWIRFLFAHGDALKSTPHLYLSALSWIPSSSPLWDIIHGSFSSELPIVLNVPNAWEDGSWSEDLRTRVRSVAYSCDRRLFAAGSEDGSIQFWDARTRKRKREPFMTESEVFSIAFSPNNRWLVSAHKDEKIRLWDLRPGSSSPRVLRSHTNLVRSVVFSLDGERIASGSDDWTIRLWDAESGTEIGEPLKGHNDCVTSVTFSAGGIRIISGSKDRTVRIWNVETGRQIGEPLSGHSNWIRSVACTRDGRRIASASADGIILLWDAQSYEQIAELAGYTGAIYSICFSFDSKYIVSGSEDYSVHVWSVDTHAMISELNGLTNRVNAVAFSPDGLSVLGGSSCGTVRIWDVKETLPVDQLSAGGLARKVCVSYVPGSNRIVAGSGDGSLNSWDTHTGAAVGKPIQCLKGTADALAVSSDGRWLVSGSDHYALQIWDITSGTTIGIPMLGHFWVILSVAVSPDNQLIASASYDASVRLWNVSTRELARTIRDKRAFTSVAFSADGQYVITGSLDYTVRIWDARTGEAVGQSLRGHWDVVMAVATSPDGKWIASSSDDLTVRIWSLLTLSEIRLFKGHARSISFSPDSQYLISGLHNGTIKIWNAQTGQAVGDPLTGHSRLINSVAFAPDGREFVSASDDKTIRVWDMRARTDLEMQKISGIDYPQLSEEELRIQWNKSRVMGNDGWISDGEKLLLWVPWQYHHDMKMGCRVVIETRSSERVRPQVDYRKVFRYCGTRWKDIYTCQDA